MFNDLLDQELENKKDSGSQFHYNCPFCGEQDQKFYVNKDNGLYICFKCEEKGNPIKFVMSYYSVTFPEAKDILEGYGYDVENHTQLNTNNSELFKGLSKEEELMLLIKSGGNLNPPSNTNNKSTLKPAPPIRGIKSLVSNFNNKESYPFLAYLHKRGVTLEQIKKHDMGYVINGFFNRLDGKEIFVRNHIVFPTLDDKGETIFWNTRSIEPNPYVKSFNAPAIEGHHSSGSAIFNLNNARLTDKIIIQEGVADALTVGESGVATFGKGISDNQLYSLIQTSKPLYLFPDMDAWRNLEKTAKRLRQLGCKAPIYYVVNTTGKDANELGYKKSWELIDKEIPANAESNLQLQLLFSK